MASPHRPRLSPRLRSARGIGLCLAMLGMLLALAAVGELALADLATDPHPDASLPHRVNSVWNNGDHLHYALHLAAGRLFELCPCTANAAVGQYWRASFHARSDLQQELVSSERPTGPTARVADAWGLTTRWLRWSVGELASLSAAIVVL